MAPSKTFNLAGLQASCVIIPDQERRRRLKAQMAKVSFEGRVNALGYKAMEAAYTKCDAWLDEAIQVIWENHRTLKQFMEERLPEIRTAKLQGTYLQWMDLRAFGWTPERQEEIMTEADLFFDEGILFGPEGKGFERMNLACPKSVLLDALSRLEKAVRQNA